MMDFITAPLVVGFICLGIYALFELFVRRKERLLIIEKISERMDIADLGKRLSLPSYGLPRFSFSSLKTGCLLMGIGLGILVGFFCNLIVAANSHSLDFRNEYEAISSAYGASVLLFGGLGLIVAFVIETNMKKKRIMIKFSLFSQGESLFLLAGE